MKEFKIKALPDRDKIKKLAEKAKINMVCAAIMLQKGIEDEFDAEEFLTGTANYMHDPFLLKDMEKAVKLLADAREHNRKVWVFGDSDIDGMTSLAIVYGSLKQLGFNVRRYLPDRQRDLYDIKPNQAEYIAKEGCDLLITTDCGSNAKEAVKRAKELGMKVIVTDHHIVSDPAKPDALINPMQEDCQYPYKYLSGTGVAYKLIMAYTLKYSLDPWGFSRSVMDYLCFATIADFMPMTGENRVIVKTGLKALADTEKAGLSALLRDAYLFKDITPKQLQFKAIPKLNSAGRMGETEKAYRLLVSDNFEEAETLCKEINEINRKRLELEDAMAKEAELLIRSENMENDKILILYNPEWNHSICGNLSAKLSIKYRKPVISIGTIVSEGTVYAKGSGRNRNDDINLFETVEKAKEPLIVFGGHKSAVGVTMKPENAEIFRKKVLENFETCPGEDEEKEYDINLKISAINLALCADLEKLAPFGEKNPEPVFVSKNLEIKQLSVMGKDRKHTKMVFEKKPGEYVEAVRWNWTDDSLKTGQTVDVAYTLEINEFNFAKTPQMIIRDIIVRKTE